MAQNPLIEAGTIASVHNPWRDGMIKPAQFIDAPFYVDTAGRESGRRIVVHEFPKKDQPYSEDMGRKAIAFTVRAYCIAYPFDDSSGQPGGILRQRDYRISRDLLVARLDSGEYGPLQLPLLPGQAAGQRTMIARCERYRLTEGERFGGYCTFDITFIEIGAAPGAAPPNPRLNLLNVANGHQLETIRAMQQVESPGSGFTEFPGTS
jgi:hypothetical protein